MVTEARAAGSGPKTEGLSWASVFPGPETTGALRKPRNDRTSGGARQNKKGSGPVPFILQEGKLRLREETDLLKIYPDLPSQRHNPVLLCSHSETRSGTLLEALQISM